LSKKNTDRNTVQEADKNRLRQEIGEGTKAEETSDNTKSPVKNVNVIESDKYRSALPEASGATAAAIMAQVAASGFTISWREVPNTA
jgi:hypothetical protein